MKQLLLVATLGVCTMPAMAAGPVANHPLFANARTASASSLPALPTIPIHQVQIEHSLTVPGFGKGGNANLPTLNLPGLATVTDSYSNPGKGNGNAKAANEITLGNTTNNQTATTYAADYTVAQSGQLNANYNFTGAGFGSKNHPDPKTTTLPLGGTLVRTYDDEGAGKSLQAGLDYTSPTPKN